MQKNHKYTDIEKILPHKKPMILIDRILEYDIEKLLLNSKVDISENSMFFDKTLNGVPSWIGLEYMAQSIAALSGIMEYEKSAGEPVMGFVLGTRKYENFIDFYRLNQTYKVEAEELFNNMELCCFSCIIKDGHNNICASAELNLFRPQNPQEFLENLKNG